MNPLKAFARRFALFVRNAGQFSRAEDSDALRRQTKSALARLDAVERRIAELRTTQRDTRDLVRQSVDIAKSGATQSDVRELRAAMRDLEQLMERQASGVRGDTKDIRRHLERMESQLQSALRHLYAPAGTLPYPWSLTSQRFGVLSQNGEDGITWAILQQIGATDRRFVDIGCADHGWNTGFLAEECGWSGLMVDSDANAVALTRSRFPSRVRTATVFVTPDNIDELFTTHGFAGEIDLLSIDIDSSDFWLWRGLTVCRPRLVIIEYNSVFGGERAVVVPYTAGRQWDAAASEHRYFGASLKAIERLARDKGYRLVAIEADSANAFLVRADVAGSIPATPAEQLFRPQRKYLKDDLRRSADACATFASLNLPLIDVSA